MRWRRSATEHAVLAWRAERSAVLEALAVEGVPVAVGPFERGWTVARVLVNDSEVVEPRERDAVDLLDDLARTLGVPGATSLHRDDGAVLVVVTVPGRPPVSAQVPSVLDGSAPVRADWADVLRAVDGLGRLEEVLAAAQVPAVPDRRGRTGALLADRRARRVAEAVGLPDGLLDPGLVTGGASTREVVVVPRLQPGDVEVAASATGLALRWTGAGGVAVVVAEDVDDQVLLPVAAGLAAGRTASLLLWRQGGACGYQLVRRGDVLDTHVWDDAWEVRVPTEDVDEQLRADLLEALAPAEGDAPALLQHAPGERGSVDAVAVRTVLRRPPGPDRLVELCEVLGLPPLAAAVPDGADPDDLQAAWTAVQPGSVRRAVLTAVTAPRADDPWFKRVAHRKPWWYRVASLVWVAAVVAWVVELWPDGGTAARVGAVVLALTGIWSAYDALSRSRRDAPPG